MSPSNPLPGRASAPADHLVWHNLAGHHAAFAVGDARVRRYRPGFLGFAACADPHAPDAAALARWFAPGENALLMLDAPLPERARAGWQTLVSKRALRMHWHGVAPPIVPAPPAVPLGPRDLPAMAALAREAGAAGMFAPRCLELGRFRGVFDAGRLVAMAGTRMGAGGLREIASVCTHPAQRGRGHASALVQQLVADIVAGGERPMLWVAEGSPAQRIYESLGFRVQRPQFFVMLQRRPAEGPGRAAFRPSTRAR